MPKWIAYAVVTFVIWGVWGFVNTLAAKNGVTALPNAVLFTVGLIPAAIVVSLSPGVRVGTRKGLGFFYGVLTGIAGGLGNVAIYQATETGKAAVVYPLTGVYPLVTVAIAWVAMRERLNRVQLVGIGVAVAALFVVSASPETWSDPAAFRAAVGTTWMGFTLVAVFFWGVTGVTQKLATNHVSPELSLLGFVTGFLPMTAFILLFTRADWSFGRLGWFYGILAGSLMGFGTLTSLAAFRSGGKASVVTALTGLNPVLTVLLMILVLGESREWYESAGIALALAAGVALSYETPAAATDAPPGFETLPVGSQPREPV